MIDFEWYRSFVAVYQMGTVSGAANRRNMTQPTISQHLQVLEQNLNTQLFERTPRRMVPTVSGRRLYQEVLGAVERLEQAASPQLATRNTRIGMKVDFFDEFVIGALAKSNGGEMPYPLQFVFGNGPQLLTYLENGDVDIAVVGERLNKEQVHYALVGTLSIAIIAPPGTKVPDYLLTEDEIAEWLAAQQWLTCEAKLGYLRQFWQMMFDYPYDFENVLSLGDCHASNEAVAHGMGLSIAPMAAVRSDIEAGRLVVPYQHPCPPEYTLYLACLHEQRNNPAFDWFLDLLREATS